jgi:hypothetical protein
VAIPPVPHCVPLVLVSASSVVMSCTWFGWGDVRVWCQA